LILGKFMPPHKGHCYLADFARRCVDELVILVCSLEDDPIPGAQRVAWMRALFPDCRVIAVTEDLPQTPADHPDFWALWRSAIQRLVPEPVDWVFSSEPYGDQLAEILSARHIPVDPKRETVPVSGAQIRTAPMRHWAQIPALVQPWFLKKVCLFGPESVGKSTLSAQLAKHYHTTFVAEFARTLLNVKEGTCELGDIPVIARGQLASEDAASQLANRILFCDTDLVTTTIWSHVLFGECPPWIERLAAERSYDLYLLLDIDVPWIADEQRCLREYRAEFMQLCVDALQRQQRPYQIIRGPWETRFKQACQWVDALLEEPAR